MITRPMKACDADLSRLRFPLIAMPKIDGVRGLIVDGQFCSRTMRAFGNRSLASAPQLANNLDFEIVAHSPAGQRLPFEGAVMQPSLCRDTTSIVNSHEGGQAVYFAVFDCFESPGDSYLARLSTAELKIRDLLAAGYSQFQLVPWITVFDLDQLQAVETAWLAAGFEGVILRDPKSGYKQGRATVRENSYLRIKRFEDAEAEVVEFFEAEANLNPLSTRPDGLSERSSHAENKVGKGMVGGIVGRRLDDGAVVMIGPGTLTHAERAQLWETRDQQTGRIFTYKHFPHGVKTAPRMATFKHWRDNNV